MNILVERETKGRYLVYDKKGKFIFSLVRDDRYNVWKFDAIQSGYEFLQDKKFSTYMLAKDFLTTQFNT